MKSWVFAVIGGLLILGSSAISGIWVTSLESSLNKYSEKIAEKKLALARADSAYTQAQIRSEFATLTRTVVRYSDFQNEEIQQQWDAVYSASLYPIILMLREANGLSITKPEISSLITLQENASSGDKQAYKKLQAHQIELVRTSGTYRAGLVLEIGQLEAKKNAESSTIAKIKEFAIFIQLLGLIILLMKEVPEKTLRKTSDDDQSQPQT
ncbi:hypothetical protein [Pseudoalteromonas byunsanensis]|uniref:Chemotaxis methyl-accepting receptor HlyB-like 4HB MCP domain-containing protein n=1 Tax=Pseudoalteromonas byunsanensis TaxID=327939 RepID=A0A1S1N242_9GAMM|nr:hypothetical protein [Pseudoalteromonas byunsanensis]OHU93436.1 hypothetical protein BIW53_18925 [Pseudoalteromonas byunsanensis]